MFLRSIINNKIRFYLKIFFLGSIFFAFNTVDAATLKINSSSETLSPGSITTLSVILNSEGLAINNAEAKIIFPTDLLEVVSISKGNSIFSLWVEEPVYSNIAGTINFNGGIPTPGFNGSNGTAISIVIKAKKIGQADLIFSDAAVRANDGLGTDVLKIKTGKTLSIVQKEESVKTEVEIPKATSPAITLQVTSPTHPSQELWYKDSSPLFKWEGSMEADAVQTGIDNHTSGTTRVTYRPAIEEKLVKDLKDGIWYFKVRAQKDGKWGPVSTYIARIDNTVPKNNKTSFSYDDINKVLNINTDIIDETSGLDYYEIYINDLLVKKISGAELTYNNYNISFKNPGDNNVKLVAVDRAGNSIESLGNFKTTAVLEKVEVATSIDKSFIMIGSKDIPLIYFILASVLIIIVLFIGAFKLGRHYHKFGNQMRVRKSLSKGDEMKVLLLLKRRLEKHLAILQRIRKNRLLTDDEKEIKDAIEGDLDEIDKIIND